MSTATGNSSNQPSALHTDSKTLWVGDIESWMDDFYISELFGKIGPVVAVKLIRDKQSGAPMGYGFVEFASHEIAARVLQVSNGSLQSGGNKQFRLNWGFFGGSGNPSNTNSSSNHGTKSDSRKPNENRHNDRDRSGSTRKHPASNDGYQIYVGELDIGISKQQLLEPFKKKYHSAFDSKIITDPATKLSKGYGFVQFSNYEESQKAITEMQGFLIRGKPIKVSPGFSRNSMNAGGSGGKGGNSSGQSRNWDSNSDGANGPGGVFALGAGTMLGGLGVQIKPPDNPTQPSMMGLNTAGQPFAYIPGQNPGTNHLGFQTPGMSQPQNMYAQALAAQQKLL